MRRSYDTDLIDEQWTKISSLYPEANHRGRPRTIDFREITNAILYIVRAGCAWRLLPHDATQMADGLLLLPSLAKRGSVAKNS